MRYNAFIRYQISQYLLHKRWLIIIPLALVLGYWAINVISFLGTQNAPLPGTAESQALNQSRGSAWEAFIWAFGKPDIVYLVTTTLYIYLIKDLLKESVFAQWALMRLGSRRLWWCAKTLTLFFCTLVFVSLLFGTFFLIVSFRFPFTDAWSQAGRSDGGMGIGFAIIQMDSPFSAAAQIAGLLAIGWFAIGCLVLTITQLTQRDWAGFLGGFLVTLSGYLGSTFSGAINDYGGLAWLQVRNHLEYTPSWSPMRDIPISLSVIYWLTWIIVLFFIGMASSQRRDIGSIER